MMELKINPEQSWHKLKAIFWIATSSIVLLCLATIIVVIKDTMPTFSKSYYYDVYYRDNIVCRGGATDNGLSITLEVIDVLEWKEDRNLAANSPVSLVVDGAEYNIVEITPSTLRAIVGEGETIEEYIDDRNTLWVTIDNSESDSLISYGLQCTFDNSKVSTIDLFQNAPAVAESRYRFAIDGQLLPALPADLKEMEKILGEPISIEKTRIY